jgi:hypothetical protein
MMRCRLWLTEEANTDSRDQVDVSGTFTRDTAMKQARSQSTEKDRSARLLLEGANDPRYIEAWAKKKSSGPASQW